MTIRKLLSVRNRIGLAGLIATLFVLPVTVSAAITQVVVQGTLHQNRGTSDSLNLDGASVTITYTYDDAIGYDSADYYQCTCNSNGDLIGYNFWSAALTTKFDFSSRPNGAQDISIQDAGGTIGLSPADDQAPGRLSFQDPDFTLEGDTVRHNSFGFEYIENYNTLPSLSDWESAQYVTFQHYGNFRNQAYLDDSSDPNGVQYVFTGTPIYNVYSTGPEPPLSAEISIVPGAGQPALHPQHDGNLGPNGIAAFPDDTINVIVITQSTAVGDPIDLDASDIDPTTLAFGPSGGPISPEWTPVFGLDADSDGLYDAAFEFQTSESGIACGDEDASLSGQLTSSGSAFVGVASITTDCQAQCHN